jgi:hypothetical protein
MDSFNIDNFLLPKAKDHKKEYGDRYVEHYLEQYRLYLHIFNATIERRQKSNEFFMGLNTAIIAFLGYIEVKDIEPAPSTPIIFLFVPVIGICFCYSWFLMIRSYKNLNRAKFKVIHHIEKNLPLSNFETEWEILGRAKDKTKYRTLSSIEKNIPLIFSVLYVIVFMANFSQVHF